MADGDNWKLEGKTYLKWEEKMDHFYGFFLKDKKQMR